MQERALGSKEMQDGPWRLIVAMRELKIVILIAWKLTPALRMKDVKANRQRRSSWSVSIHPRSIETLKKRREQTRPL
jgi:hypothetical protein